MQRLYIPFVFLCLLLFGCQTTPAFPTPDVPATITAQVTAEVQAHLSSLPTATPLPTQTPYPTATRYPTNTPSATATNYPTSTPRPTDTPYPTATPYPTPRPTSTPLPTPTPTPATKWGIPNAPVTVRDIADSTVIQQEPFILRGCFTGITTGQGGLASTKEYIFSLNGGSNRSSDYAAVLGFRPNTHLSSRGCYLMAVEYVDSDIYCYYESIVPVYFGCPSDSWDYNTPIFKLTDSSSYETVR